MAEERVERVVVATRGEVWTTGAGASRTNTRPRTSPISTLANPDQQRSPAFEDDDKRFHLAQVAVWLIIAVLHVSLAAIIDRFAWVSVVIYGQVGILGYLVSRGLRAITLRFRWHELGLGAWLLRSLPACLAGGALIIATLTLLTRLASPLLVRMVKGFQEVKALSDPNQLAGLTLYWSGVLVAWHLCLYGYEILRRLRRSERKQWQLEAAVADSELRALKSHLNPHFVFNALNSIRGLVEEEPTQAREMITRLSSMLRSTLGAAERTTVSLEQELSTVRDYLALEAVRFEDRLLVDIEVDDDTLALQVPPLIVQHLIENAVKHGIGDNPGPGHLEVSARRAGATLEIVVRNEGRIRRASRSGDGLEHSRRRLGILYDERASLSIDEQDGWVAATLQVPIS